MTRLLFAGCLLFAFLPLFLNSQMKNITHTVPSPNASSLGLYGEIPVSYFTGVPDISVPLYALQAKLPVQVNLRYHAAGVRPEIHPSWVGLGWNLSAGGAITRVINKAPDELNLASVGIDYYQAGFYYNHNAINTNDWNITRTLRDFKDVEPDVFNFNFLGISGKFFMDETGAWRVQSDRALKVEFDNVFYDPFIKNSGYAVYDLVTATFNQFTIIDENGTKYLFGGTENAIEYTEEMTPAPDKQGEHFYATTWYLIKITSADSTDVINYEYERGPFNSSIGVSTTLISITGNPNGTMDPGCSSWSQYIRTYGKLISPVYLKKITYPKKDLRISFEFSKSNDLTYSDADYSRVEYDAYGYTGTDFLSILDYTTPYIPWFQSNAPDYSYTKRLIWFKLDNVKVQNAAGTRTLKTVSFNYNNVPDERLELQSIQLKDENNKQQQTWVFGYNALTLPNYLSSITDHWGFNNNVSTPYNNNIYNYNELRQPNALNSQARILTLITYPTGGKTKFDYELNKYSAYVSRDRQSIISENGDAGGLRIKKITHEDGTGATKVTEYFYVKNYRAGVNVQTLPSSGVLDVKPQYSFNNLSGVDNGGATFSYSLFTSSSVIPVSFNSSGTHVGYSEVIEKRSDNSYTRYTFTNHDNGYTDQRAVSSYNSTYAPYLPFTSHDFTRGKPLLTMQYDKNNNIIYQKTNVYDFVGDQADKRGRSVHWNIFNICTDVTISRVALIKSAYYNPYYVLLLKDETEDIYGKGGHVSVAKHYEYDADYKQVRKISSTNSRNLLQEVYYTYPFDKQSITVYKNMAQANIVAPKIEEAHYVDSQLNKKTIISYREWYTGLFMPEYEQEQLGGGALQTVRYFDGYDADGNLLSFRDKQNASRTLIWDDKHQLIADAVNAAPGRVLHHNFENGSGWDSFLTAYDNTKKHSGNYSGRIDKPGAGEQVAMGATWINVSLTGTTKFKYSGWVYSNGPGVEIFLFMKRAGETGYFSYLDVVSTTEKNKWVLLEKEFNVPADVTQLNIRIDNNGGGSVWFDDIRLHPSAAQMTTYTYDPLVGVTGKSDINNVTTYYEYDNFSRLHLVRDNRLNVVKQICYNYAGQPEDCMKTFGNDPMQKVFAKNNCGVDYVGEQMTYRLDAGVYVSFVSKEDANRQALNDINTKGQPFVNENGACVRIVYARLDFKDPKYVVLENEGDQMREEERSDMYIRFFSDAACTQEANVTNLILKVQLDADVYANISPGPNPIEVSCDGHLVLAMDDVPVKRSFLQKNEEGRWQVISEQLLHHGLLHSPYIRIVQ
jgi:YD repeat-containing protein